MKAAVLTGVQSIEVREVEDPHTPEGGLLIEVETCAICGTDVKMHRYGYAAAKLPLIPGHELAGTVRETGAAGSGFKAGDRVILYAGPQELEPAEHAELALDGPQGAPMELALLQQPVELLCAVLPFAWLGLLQQRYESDATGSESVHDLLQEYVSFTRYRTAGSLGVSSKHGLLIYGRILRRTRYGNPEAATYNKLGRAVFNMVHDQKRSLGFHIVSPESLASQAKPVLEPESPFPDSYLVTSFFSRYRESLILDKGIRSVWK